MDDRAIKAKKIAYNIILILIIVAGGLLIAFGIITRQYNGKAFIILGSILLALAIPYYFLASYLKFNTDDSYKELLLANVMRTYNYSFYSKQTGIKNNKYMFTKDEIKELNYVNIKELDTLFSNDLLLGKIRDVNFRSMNFKLMNDKKLKYSEGRIYSFDYKLDSNYKLVIKKDEYEKDLTKINIKGIKLNAFTNDVEKTDKLLNALKIKDDFEMLEKYGELFIKVYNGSLYLIIKDYTEFIDLERHKTYFDVIEQIDLETTRINHIINSFKYQKQIKEKPLNMD